MWSGFYQGILDYQTDVDKKKAKLAEKLEKRMENLIAIAAKRDASIKKIPSYRNSMAIINARLEGVDSPQAAKIRQGIEFAPSTAPELVKYIKAVEKENGGIELTGEEFVNAIDIFEIGGAAKTNYTKTADYFGSLNIKDLKDLKVYGEGIRKLSQVPSIQEGTFLYETAPIQKFKSERMKAQNNYLEQGINNEITAVVTKGLKKPNGEFRKLSNGTPLTAETIKTLRENAKNELIKLTELTDEDGKYLFGLKTVKTALDLGTPQFVGVLQRNPSFQAILLNQIPQDKIQRLLDFRDTDVFDQAFGKGAAAFILSKYGG
tara:strand:+ start:7621 stop:8577 length:957 start_codon:yes stop_codon:yes gene_type:complete